ncbi:Stage II sporulation protein Q [Sphingobacterium daejeonense]|nr:Stage II sporulation protein Q [Sphingobacterium daejeonense]
MVRRTAFTASILLLICQIVLAQQVQPKHIALYPPEISIPHPDIPETSPLTLDSIKPLPELPTLNVIMPLTEYRMTSKFGWRKHPITGKRDFHNGIDLATRAGIVRSIMEGTVESTGYHRNLGNYVCIDHGFVHSVYGHLSRVTVKNGQAIAAGYPVGITGKSGRTTGEHLHFSIRSNGIYIDPWKFLRRILQHIENEH